MAKPRKTQRAKPAVLTGKQRSRLRSLAHDLNAVVQIGHAGLTANVVKQVDEALFAHELIKVKLGQECPDTASDAAAQLASETAASVAQIIGRVIVLYRRHPDAPHVQLMPTRAAAKKVQKPLGAKARAAAKTKTKAKAKAKAKANAKAKAKAPASAKRRPPAGNRRFTREQPV